jgi:hypothetical protein
MMPGPVRRAEKPAGPKQVNPASVVTRMIAVLIHNRYFPTNLLIVDRQHLTALYFDAARASTTTIANQLLTTKLLKLLSYNALADLERFLNFG